TPPTSMNATPKTTWWMCRPPGVTLPGHHRTWARIIRTLQRISRKPATNATKKLNSGNRPVATMWTANQSLTHASFVRDGRGRQPGERGVRGRAAHPRACRTEGGTSGRESRWVEASVRSAVLLGHPCCPGNPPEGAGIPRGRGREPDH